MENQVEVIVPSKKEIIVKQGLEITDLKKKIETLESNAKYLRQSRDDAINELNDVHEFLDGFDYVLPHTKKDGYTKNKLSTRLMSYFIKASHG